MTTIGCRLTTLLIRLTVCHCCPSNYEVTFGVLATYLYIGVPLPVVIVWAIVKAIWFDYSSSNEGGGHVSSSFIMLMDRYCLFCLQHSDDLISVFHSRPLSLMMTVTERETELIMRETLFFKDTEQVRRSSDSSSHTRCD